MERISVTDLMKLGMSKEVANIFMFEVLKPQEEELLRLRGDFKTKSDSYNREVIINKNCREEIERLREFVDIVAIADISKPCQMGSIVLEAKALQGESSETSQSKEELKWSANDEILSKHNDKLVVIDGKPIKEDA